MTKIAKAKAGSKEPPVVRDATPEEEAAIIAGREPPDPPQRNLASEIDALKALIEKDMRGAFSL